MSQEKIFHPGDKRPRDEDDELKGEAVNAREAEPEEENNENDAEARAFEIVFEAHGYLLWGNPQHALALYNQSLQVAVLPIAFYARGLAKFLLGNLDESLVDVQTAIDSAECEEARVLWVSEKIVMCSVVGNFPEVRRLSRNYPLADDPKKRYLELKSLVCSDDVSWEEVKAEAIRFFDGFSQYTQTYREPYSDQFSWAIKLLKKFSMTLSEAEKTEVVTLLKNELLRNINRIIDFHTVRHEDQFFLRELWLEASIRSYLCEFAGLALEKTDPEFCAMAQRVRGITFRDTRTLPPHFLEILLQMPLKKSTEEDEALTPPQEHTAEEIEGFIQQTKQDSRTGSIPEMYAQIKGSYNQLLYGRAEDEDRPDWRGFNWSEFFHLLPEFTGRDYRELFMSLRHELLIAQMTSAKTDYLESEAFVEEHVNLTGMCTVLFERYNECKVFMHGQNQVAQRVSRNATIEFQYILLDELLSLTLNAIRKLFDSKQLNMLELIRRLLVLAERVSVELRSILTGNDLRKALLWDDNVSPQKVKDFSGAFHRHMTALEKFKDFEFKIREQEELARAHPLTLLYGKNNFAKKKTVVAVPFSSTLSPTFLAQSYDLNNIDKAKNVMCGFDFALTFSADCDGGRRYYTRHIQVRMNDNRAYFKYEDAASACRVTGAQLNDAVLKNIRDGFIVYDREKQEPDVTAKQMLMFEPTAGIRSIAHNAKINPFHHEHSEQAGIFWLMNNVNDVANQLVVALQHDPDFQRKGKLGNIEVDMLSDKSSCDSCKLAMLALQASEGPESFRAKLSQQLTAGGVPIAKKGLSMGSRVLSRQQYDWDSQNGRNPTEKHVAKLKNLSIFQSTQPALFMSGNNPHSHSNGKRGY